jgi:hypothetical protein
VGDRELEIKTEIGGAEGTWGVKPEAFAGIERTVERNYLQRVRAAQTDLTLVFDRPHHGGARRFRFVAAAGRFMPAWRWPRLREALAAALMPRPPREGYSLTWGEPPERGSDR